MKGQDIVLVGGGTVVLVFQVYFIPSVGFPLSALVFVLVSFAAAFLASRRPFLFGMLPAAGLVLATFGRDILIGRVELPPENILNRLVVLSVIALVSAVGALAGTWTRLSLRNRP